jgi:oligoendopeptidase F
VPTLSVFFRKKNYEALRKAEEKTHKTIGNLLNKLVKDHLQEVVAEEDKGALRSANQT